MPPLPSPTPKCQQLWRDQLLAFIDEVMGGEPCVVVGNSLGSLAALMTAAGGAGGVAGVVLLNCAGGMNNKAIADDWRIKLLLPLFWLIDALLQTPPVAAYIFERFRTRDNIRAVLQVRRCGPSGRSCSPCSAPPPHTHTRRRRRRCALMQGVYRNQAAVDDELVDLIYTPRRARQEWDCRGRRRGGRGSMTCARAPSAAPHPFPLPPSPPRSVQLRRGRARGVRVHRHGPPWPSPRAAHPTV